MRVLQVLLVILSLAICCVGAWEVAVQLRRAYDAPNKDPGLERLLSSPIIWPYVLAPYAAFAAVAIAFRKRPVALLIVLCVTAPAVFYGLIDAQDNLRAFPPGAGDFPRGLGYGSPMGLVLVATVMGVLLKALGSLLR